MADTGKHVFISIGNRYTAEQKAFLQALIALLMQCGVTPRIMNSGKDYATDNFLKNIQTVMRECHGAIVVAFERKFFPTGTEKRGSSKERSLTNCTFPTPWNQIEAAMALALEIPIFV